MRRFLGVSTAGLARICGVSQGTVDRALHDRDGISPNTKARILAIAKEYGYAPRVEGARGKKSMLIGVVLFDLYNAFFSKLAMSLVTRAKEVGYSVIFQFSNKSPSDERAALDYFSYIGVDGIILFPTGSDAPEYTEYLRSLARPVVTVGNRLEGIDYVGVDDEGAMYELSRQMLRECGGDVAYFAPILKKELHSRNAQLLRRDGYIRAVREFGGRVTVVTSEDELKDSVAGVISSTDHYVLRVLGRFGIGTEMRLAGFDNTDLVRRIGKDILTVEYSTDAIAEECVKYVLGRRYNGNIPYSVVLNT